MIYSSKILKDVNLWKFKSVNVWAWIKQIPPKGQRFKGHQMENANFVKPDVTNSRFSLFYTLFQSDPGAVEKFAHFWGA